VVIYLSIPSRMLPGLSARKTGVSSW